MAGGNKGGNDDGGGGWSSTMVGIEEDEVRACDCQRNYSICRFGLSGDRRF